MMEKGLQAVYSGYIAGNGTTISKSKKEDIHGMQWSVNASVGAAYRFMGIGASISSLASPII